MNLQREIQEGFGGGAEHLSLNWQDADERIRLDRRTRRIPNGSSTANGRWPCSTA